MNPQKVHPALLKEVRAKAPDTRLSVIWKYTPRQGAVPKALQEFPVKRTYRLFPAVACELTIAQIDALSQELEVAMIWPDLPVRALLDVSVPTIRAPQVWETGYKGGGVKIAIVDTGIDIAHPDFAGRITALADFTQEGNQDLSGHGTHVAGIAAGSGKASNGKYRGVAPEATLYAAKVLDRDGFGPTSQVIAGIEWAVEQEVDIINLSLGTDPPCDGTDALSEVCDMVVERGFVVCAAAGNFGPDLRSVGAPGCARLVITVGASTDADQVADFSSRGPTADGRPKPDLVMPGAGIVSARAKDTTIGDPLNEHYTAASGTSMATPHASGLAALLLQARPDLTPAQIKSLMISTAADLGARPEAQGAGRGDAFAASQAEPVPLPQPEPIPQPEGCLPRLLRALLP